MHDSSAFVDSGKSRLLADLDCRQGYQYVALASSPHTQNNADEKSRCDVEEQAFTTGNWRIHEIIRVTKLIQDKVLLLDQRLE